MAGRAVVAAIPEAGSAILMWGGEVFEEWLGIPPQGVAVDDLPDGLGHGLGAMIREAVTTGEPVRRPCTRVTGGFALATDILMLPLRDRAGGRRVLACLAGETSRTNLLEAVLRSTGQGVLALSAIRAADGAIEDFQIVALNGAAAEIGGRPLDTLLWQRLSVFAPDMERLGLLARLRDALRARRRVNFEIAYPRRDAPPLHLQVEGASLGDYLGLTLTDIGDVKLREESARLLFETNPLPMWVADPAGRFLAVNDAAISHYGYPREEFLLAALREIEVTPAGEGGEPALHRCRDGSLIEVVPYARRVPFRGGEAMLTVLVDVTEKRRAEARIVHMAHHDALTDLPNRTLFRQRVLEAIADQRRRGGVAGLLCLDLDRFKLVNDTLGHPAGDDLLRQVAGRLVACAGGGTVARFGGDEFALVVPADDSDCVMAVAERIVAALTRPFDLSGHAVTIGGSVGVALVPEHGTDADDVLHRADQALYAAKGAGRGTAVAFASAMEAASRERSALGNELRVAVATGALKIHYQPLFDARSLRLSGCEALLRWQHPERGFVPPADFLPIAEEIGLIDEIGSWALRAACREAAAWPARLRLAVNLSPGQLRNPTLALTVVSAVAQAGLDPHRLDLEITESVLLSNRVAELPVLRDLRALGARIAIDDFGTGYGSLSNLQAFPFDAIKIAPSFTRRLGEDPFCAAILRALTDLGRSLGIATVAEGVETRRQFDALRASRCSLVQGRFLAPPVPPATLARLITAAAAA
ncbi:putative bifunctional diguanylate cyclase/phosphodiesterase [Methylobacterium sp. JK268]